MSWRRLKMKTGISLTAMIVLVAVTAFAQLSENASTDLRRDRTQRGFPVRGQVSSETTFAGTLMVELVQNGHTVSESAYVGPDGSFEFPSVSPGGYELRMIGTDGSII